MALLKECLNCSIFRWSGKYYAQMRGLAMGQRLAPTLAIAFLSRIEAPVIDPRPLLYCRVSVAELRADTALARLVASGRSLLPLNEKECIRLRIRCLKRAKALKMINVQNSLALLCALSKKL
uniref:Reverse transcriptase domain-containing protein n=1 Tax=Angiostrongylus cantonensis TaxID=6313 RepID=A0A0K0D546_ANGCA